MARNPVEVEHSEKLRISYRSGPGRREGGGGRTRDQAVSELNRGPWKTTVPPAFIVTKSRL